MSTLRSESPPAPAAGPAEAVDAAPSARAALRWGPWVGGALAIGLAAAALTQLSHAPAQALATVRRLTPAMWAAFVVLYLAQPVADTVIFRRLWRLPLAGFAVMLRKSAINEILFGYSGELYFYLWARRRSELTDAPFGAIKDVNIVSALASNVLTLVMVPIGAAALQRVDLARELGPAFWPACALVIAPFALLLFGRRVFSLGRRHLTFVAGAHVVRLAVTSATTLLLWALALPQVALGVWVVLLAGRLLLARLPVANKDLLFANLILVLFGPGSPTALLLATLALATLLAHLAVIALIGAPGLLAAARRAQVGRPG